MPSTQEISYCYWEDAALERGFYQDGKWTDSGRSLLSQLLDNWRSLSGSNSKQSIDILPHQIESFANYLKVLNFDLGQSSHNGELIFSDHFGRQFRIKKQNTNYILESEDLLKAILEQNRGGLP